MFLKSDLIVKKLNITSQTDTVYTRKNMDKCLSIYYIFQKNEQTNRIGIGAQMCKIYKDDNVFAHKIN